MKQNTALKILKDGQNVFLTGQAGSGKTYVLQKYIEHLKKEKVPHAVTASTGIAATHLGGRTIHSWTGMGVHSHLSESDIKQILKKSIIKSRIKAIKVLIIDEVSMIRAEQLNLIDKIMRHARSSWEPFGGVQVVLSGDFFQLPPIITKDEKIEKNFAFVAQSWKLLDLQICYLSEQFRQQDKGLTRILNDIRDSAVDQSTVDLLKESSGGSFDEHDDVTRLFTHNIDVDRINARALSQIDSKGVKYEMTGVGNGHVINAMIKSCLAPEMLELKEGALVMFVRNNFDAGYVNGTTGTVIDFTIDHYPIVAKADGEEVVVYPEKWSLDEEGETVAEIEQLPLRLAWAITVHKSQGMTLDAVEIDLRKCFEYGMGYVALSRARSLENMRLLGINDVAFKVDPTVITQDKKFQKQSKSVEKKIS